MHIVSNIRNADKFFEAFPLLANPRLSEAAFAQRYAASDLRARYHDLVIAQVVQTGATSTEDRDGTQRELAMGEWMIVPVVERESSFSHGSVVPEEGIAVGATVDYICRGGGVGVSADNPPGQGDPTKVQVMGILRYENGCAANARDFALNLRPSNALRAMIAIVGSKSDSGKTTACADLIKLLHQNNYRVGVAKLAGTARRGELLQLSHHANQWLDTADAGLPTTYCPSLYSDEDLSLARRHAVTAAERIVQDLSIDNDIVVAEFGGDLLAGCVPEILAEPGRLNIVAIVMAVESATAAIGMESKLHRISAVYQDTPLYVVGPVANLQANKNRVRRETACAGCYDLWSRSSASASQKQIDNSLADTQELVRKLLAHCGSSITPLASK
ncbi:MAG: hypothetical protein Q9195_006641 [Heterodermia aff. obscurata]